MKTTDLEIQNKDNNTALCFGVAFGVTKIAKLMVERNINLPGIRGIRVKLATDYRCQSNISQSQVPSTFQDNLLVSELCQAVKYLGFEAVQKKKTLNAQALKDNNNHNILHLAGKLAPSDQFHVVSGAALQMQRELLWFKEVEKIIQPLFKEIKDSEGRTPQMLFTEEHKGLAKGEKWLKNTASSCMLVATLLSFSLFPTPQPFSLPLSSLHRFSSSSLLSRLPQTTQSVTDFFFT
ncbi:hypothetical protein D0Y65_041072 [Glycine soja]|uniref:Uncharacterized protein n=1 Tax=Glycine soja TaxID=3848 RepID=A0A445GU78_GLYSO|nr:hypothetical protein D0Y65_041072 [Glycine soja]